MDPMSTYEMIKALPGKGTNWRKLVDALSAEYGGRRDGRNRSRS